MPFSYVPLSFLSRFRAWSPATQLLWRSSYLPALEPTVPVSHTICLFCCLLLQGVEPSNTAAVEKLILDKLAELAATGFTAGAIEAAVNTIEFSLRENNTGSFPRGLSLMLRAVGAWIYGRDPYTPIQVRQRQLVLYQLLCTVEFGVVICGMLWE